MPKAFIDTTILTDAVLKRDENYTAARAALQRFDVTELPVYAIKEFKAGPLANFVWFHNKLALLKSFQKGLAALQRMALSPRRYTTATALQALAEAARTNSRFSLGHLQEIYGPKASLDAVNCDMFRLAIKSRVLRAWADRRKIASNVVNPLACYTETAPREENGLLVINPVKCNVGDCCLRPLLKSKPEDLEHLRKAIPKDSTKREDQKRSQALRELIRRKPGEAMSEDSCQSLGDAVFAFFAPQDSVILTTNLRDHEPLAKALGKQAQEP